MNEETKTEKKEWTKPELVVLARSNPEEQVLTGCKLPQQLSGSPDNYAIQCFSVVCSGCYYLMPS